MMQHLPQSRRLRRLLQLLTYVGFHEGGSARVRWQTLCQLRCQGQLEDGAERLALVLDAPFVLGTYPVGPQERRTLLRFRIDRPQPCTADHHGHVYELVAAGHHRRLSAETPRTNLLRQPILKPNRTFVDRIHKQDDWKHLQPGGPYQGVRRLRGERSHALVEAVFQPPSVYARSQQDGQPAGLRQPHGGVGQGMTLARSRAAGHLDMTPGLQPGSQFHRRQPF
ncbi:hypothetical protein [Streptomyces sp. NPDC005953]|uniref:hypothetical protein n=1 Tax=Streptomyces sp. NPDC005953 TaxID=3156719 RepID=UPI0033F162C8